MCLVISYLTYVSFQLHVLLVVYIIQVGRFLFGSLFLVVIYFCMINLILKLFISKKGLNESPL